MMDVLLSASVPLPDRDRHYFETADILSIREAIKALVEVVLPIGRITFGRPPGDNTTNSAVCSRGWMERDRLTIFQSS
jgi:hypothetical protein